MYGSLSQRPQAVSEKLLCVEDFTWCSPWQNLIENLAA